MQEQNDSLDGQSFNFNEKNEESVENLTLQDLAFIKRQMEISIHKKMSEKIKTDEELMDKIEKRFLLFKKNLPKKFTLGVAAKIMCGKSFSKKELEKVLDMMYLAGFVKMKVIKGKKGKKIYKL